MAKFYTCLNDELRDFIARQHMFFVASAAREGRVNLSPKGMDTLRVIDDRCVAYLDLTGSGNETAAHILENGRVTAMFCGFEGSPWILRLYARGEVVLPGDAAWSDYAPNFATLPGARQIIVLHIDSAQTACGFAVPEYHFVQQRPLLSAWAEKKGEPALQQYRSEKNARSIDGLPTRHSPALDR